MSTLLFLPGLSRVSPPRVRQNFDGFHVIVTQRQGEL